MLKSALVIFGWQIGINQNEIYKHYILISFSIARNALSKFKRLLIKKIDNNDLKTKTKVNIHILFESMWDILMWYVSRKSKKTDLIKLSKVYNAHSFLQIVFETVGVALVNSELSYKFNWWQIKPNVAINPKGGIKLGFNSNLESLEATSAFMLKVALFGENAKDRDLYPNQINKDKKMKNKKGLNVLSVKRINPIKKVGTEVKIIFFINILNI